MFTSIKTSAKNRELVRILTKKLNLGTENHIARIAITYSLAQRKKLDINNLLDSKGKEYSQKVLFGNYSYIYTSLICTFYSISRYDKDIAKYIKLHLDNGLELLNNEINHNKNLIGYDYLISKIEQGLKEIC